MSGSGAQREREREFSLCVWVPTGTKFRSERHFTSSACSTRQNVRELKCAVLEIQTCDDVTKGQQGVGSAILDRLAPPQINVETLENRSCEGYSKKKRYQREFIRF